MQVVWEYLVHEENENRCLDKGDTLVMTIVGGVGAGKTTFIHRYFKQILPEELKKNLIWINIDFIEQSGEDINVFDYIITQCLNQIRTNFCCLQIDEWETLLEIYNADVVRLQRGALKPIYEQDKVKFNEQLSQFILNKVSDERQFGQDVFKYISLKQYQKKVICLSIDNADQLSIDFQKRCIMAAYEFSKKFKSLILLSMREETYWKLRNVKPFDAYQGYAYHISAPSVSELLAKRIETAIKYSGPQDMKLIGGTGIRFKINVNDFFKFVRSSLYDKGNQNIKFIESISANNLREAIKIFGTFLTSGHTNTREYIELYLKKGNYNIPFHAIVRSVALGDYKYYHSNKSIIFNLFDIDDDGFYSHFTKTKILQFLTQRINIDSPAGRGFVRISDMFNHFTDVCNNELNFRNVLTYLLNHRLILADNGYNISGVDADFVKITSSGYYYKEILLYEFAYLERLCEDTPIKAKKFFLQIEEYTKKMEQDIMPSLETRLSRVYVFLKYLKEQEEDEQPYITINKEILWML